MTRLLVPLFTPDVSAFTKTLKGLLDERHAAGKALPSHVELLNLAARCAGMRNFATLKAAALRAAPVAHAAAGTRAKSADAAGAAPDLSTLSPTVRKTLLQFEVARVG